jgi:hypothetical protein
LSELVQKGITMPDGSIVKLPAPTLSEGMDAAAQRAAIEKIMPLRCTFEDFTEKNSRAPIGLKVHSIKGKGDSTVRTVDLGFIAHGKWDVLISDKFGKGFTKPKDKQTTKQGGALKRSGFLSKEEIAKRGLESSTKKGQQARYFYSTFALFDLVEVSATRYAVLSQTPGSIVLAARVDPRFAHDVEYPNQWQPIETDALGNSVLGKKQPNAGASFYLKVTRLSEPSEAVFFEFHAAFHEPSGWFDGEPTLQRKLPTIVNFQVEQFRGKFARASQEGAASPEKVSHAD